LEEQCAITLLQQTEAEYPKQRRINNDSSITGGGIVINNDSSITGGGIVIVIIIIISIVLCSSFKSGIGRRDCRSCRNCCSLSSGYCKDVSNL
jgi:hypothetical protein